MKKTKKIISLILSALLTMTLFSSVAVSSFAEDVIVSGDYEYKILEDGTAEITKYNGNEENIVTPSKIDGYKVSVIGESAFQANNRLTKTIEVSSGVVRISPLAFWLCENLTEVKLPETIEHIADAAFQGCVKLQKVNLPENLQFISDELFSGCESLEEITLPKCVKEIGSHAFFGCKSLKTIEIPYGVTRISGSAFEHCESLENVIIPESVIWIESEAFEHCYNLKSVVVPENTSSLSVDCFDVKNTDFIITLYGIKGSAAENYAKNFGCNFIAVDSTHYFGEWVLDLDSTCSEFGKKHRECACGEKEEAIVEKKEHKFGNGVITKLPTLEKGGEKTYTCTECGKTKTEPMAKLIPFLDVSKDDWYYSAVRYNHEHGYFNGYGNGCFGPSNNIQRQDFVLILARIAGADLSAYEGKNGGFSDVQTGSYYASAVAWAKDKGIVTGYSADNFGVGTYISREQISLILCRYLNGSASGDVDTILNAYPDGGNTSPWAKAGVAWAVENGIIGNSDYLNPNGNAGRAEVAQIIYNMSNKGML